MITGDPKTSDRLNRFCLFFLQISDFCWQQFYFESIVIAISTLE